MDFTGRDVVSIMDFSRKEIEYVLECAEKMVSIARGEKTSDSLKGRIMASLFFEVSTRTRLSF